MNFRARVRKLEKTSNVGGFCLHHIKPKYGATLDTSGGKYLVKPLPDICEQCGKQIDKSAVEMTFDQWRARADERVRQAVETMAKFDN